MFRQKIHNLEKNSALDFNDFKSLWCIKEEFEKNEKIFIKMGNGIASKEKSRTNCLSRSFKLFAGLIFMYI